MQPISCFCELRENRTSACNICSAFLDISCGWRREEITGGRKAPRGDPALCFENSIKLKPKNIFNRKNICEEIFNLKNLCCFANGENQVLFQEKKFLVLIELARNILNYKKDWKMIIISHSREFPQDQHLPFKLLIEDNCFLIKKKAAGFQVSYSLKCNRE